MTNEYYPLRDEGEAYGRRLSEAGNVVTTERMPGMIHSSLQRGARIDGGNALLSRIATALRALG